MKNLYYRLIAAAMALVLLLSGCSGTAQEQSSEASNASEQAVSQVDSEQNSAETVEAPAADTASADETGEAAEEEAADTGAADTGAADNAALKEADEEAEPDQESAAEETEAAYTRGGITWLSPSAEALEERESLQEQPQNFIWKSVFFKITMWILRDNYKQNFPDQWTACEETKLTYGSNDVYQLTPVYDEPDCIILYIHGGGYVYTVNGSESIVDQLTVCDKLAINLHAEVYIPLYTLSPRGTWKDCYQLLDDLYEDLEATGKPIYILGDSAGGGTALAYTMFRRDRGDTLPEKLILLSPWLDMSLSNPEIAAYERTDNILSPYALKQFGKFWSGDLETTDPLVSPIYGDLSGLPPTMVIAGTEEIMYPDIAKLYENMTDAGSEISLICGQQLWHDFVGADIPEADECIEMMVSFCRDD